MEFGAHIPFVHHLGFKIQTVKSAHKIAIFNYGATLASQYQDVVVTGDPVGNTLSPPVMTDLTPLFAAFPLLTLPPNIHIRDVCISPDSNPGYDRAYMLIKDIYPASQKFVEVQFQLSQTGLVAAVPLRTAQLDLVSGIPPTGPPQQSLYYYDPVTTMGFANWFDTPSASWVCWKWYESPPGTAVTSRVTGISHRIDALLATGELFSTEGDVGRIYDQNGNQLSQFSLTGFSFVGEVYVGGTAQVLFSQTLWFGNNALYFNVYSIPSSDLKKLGQ